MAKKKRSKGKRPMPKAPKGMGMMNGMMPEAHSHMTPAQHKAAMGKK